VAVLAQYQLGMYHLLLLLLLLLLEEGMLW
jgi:hypothetical protein